MPWMRRAWIFACLALACRAAPVAAPTNAGPRPTTVQTPAPTFGWEPLRSHRGAALPVPATRDAASCDAAAEAANQAGVLDVAAYWRAEAHAFAPSPARAAALAEARTEAGYGGPVRTLEPLEPMLARSLRTAVEAHAWDEVLASTGPALADAPHHELYLWAGDALWQQGHEVPARQMWSRARVLLATAGAAMRVRLPQGERVRGLGWSRSGLAYHHGSGPDNDWLEVWGDRLERPWRRWQLARGGASAWSDGVYAVADGPRLTLHDPASGAAVATVVAHAEPIIKVAAAAATPVFATSTKAGEIKVWTWSPGLFLEPIEVIAATTADPLVALDPSGTQLAIRRPGAPIELVSLRTGAKRTLPFGVDLNWTTLQFQGERDLLVASDAVVRRVHLAPGRDELVVVRRRDSRPDRRVLATSDTGALAFVDVARELVAICDEPQRDCRDRFPQFGTEWTRMKNGRTTGTQYGGEASFSPTGDRLAVAYGHSVLVEDPTSAAARRISPPVDHALEIAGVTRDGGTLAIEGQRGLAVWDARTGAKLVTRDKRGFLGFSPDGRAAAIVGEDPPHVEVVPLAGGPSIQLRTGGPAWALRFSSDGRLAAIVSRDEIGVWDVTSGAELWRDQPAPGPIGALAFTARGELVFETSDGIHVRDASGGPTRRVLRGDMFSWTVSPDGNDLLVCPDPNNGARLIDLRTGRVRRTFRDVRYPQFIDDHTVFTSNGVIPHFLDVRTGRHTPDLEIAGGVGEARMANDRVVAGTSSRGANLVLLTHAGRVLARVNATADLGWLAVTGDGAVDGDAASLAGMEVQVELGPAQRYPAALAWDALHVPGLLPRVFAGARVRPPVPR